jgi:hypothetical protein
MLLSDADLRAALSDAGRRAIRDSLSWTHQEERYIAMYRDLLGTTP